LQEVEQTKAESARYDTLPLPLKVIFLSFSVLGIGLAVYYIFSFSIAGECLLNVGYYYLLIAFYSSLVFLILPARKKDRSIPWYDLIATILIFGICFYYFLQAYDLSVSGWRPTVLNIVLGTVLFLLITEGGRRSGGNVYLIVIILFACFPLFAPYMPGLLWGKGHSFIPTIGSLVFTQEGLLGIATKVTAEILVGFLLFAGFLIASGAGKFFLDLATVLLGRFRGGPAKVAVLSSGFFGSLSGSIFSNIVATGSVTIPTMKRIGYPAHYAGAVEACASTGGVLMPPVMGAAAFIMSEMIGVEYGTIIVAAAIPSILYYFGLLMQVDAYAARVGLKGLPHEEIPSLKKVLAEGWPFIFVFIFLVWGLLYMRWERFAPYYATVLLFLLSFIRKDTRLTPRRMVDTIATIGKLITQSIAIILPIGFIINGLTITGVSASFTAGLVHLGGGNVFTILIVGVIACYLLGMAGLLTPAYIFLAVSLAPAVIQIANLNVVATHLFIMYYAMLAAITPPVAAGAFLAGTIAGANLMKTAFQSVRLGIVIYFIPFFFVFNPALVLQGSILETVYLLILCLIGIVIIAGGFEGYLLKVGNISFWARPLLVISGLLIGFPEWLTTIIGAILAVFVIMLTIMTKRRTSERRLV